MIISKQENREYDVHHDLLIKDIKIIILKETSLEILSFRVLSVSLKERNQVKYMTNYTVFDYHYAFFFSVSDELNINYKSCTMNRKF